MSHIWMCHVSHMNESNFMCESMMFYTCKSLKSFQVHACTFVCTYEIGLHICMYGWMHKCMYVCMYVCIYIYTRRLGHTFCARFNICNSFYLNEDYFLKEHTYIYIYIYIYIHIYTHIYTRMHMQKNISYRIYAPINAAHL